MVFMGSFQGYSQNVKITLAFQDAGLPVLIEWYEAGQAAMPAIAGLLVFLFQCVF
jgi:hypothetical protein